MGHGEMKLVYVQIRTCFKSLPVRSPVWNSVWNRLQRKVWRIIRRVVVKQLPQAGERGYR
jgi:hypothetical protein